MKIQNIRSLGLVSMVALIPCFAFAVQSAGGHSAARGKAASASPAAPVYKNLNIVIESPFGIAEMTDGTVVVIVPSVDPHTFAFIKGLNDCGLGGADYIVDTSSHGQPPGIDPDGLMKNELNLDWNTTKQIQVDPKGYRFASFAFKAPDVISALHVDPLTVSPNPVPSPVTASNSYATVIALRYTANVQPIKLFQADGTTPACTPDPQPAVVGDEGILTIGVGPQADDDDHHTHANAAFNAIQKLFPPVKLYLGFPPAPTHGPLSTMIHATDCHAPALLVHDIPVSLRPALRKQPPRKAAPEPGKPNRRVP